MAELIVLGAGVPKPSPERFGTSLVLTLDGQNLMFDCGPATTHKLVKGGLWPTAVDYLFFTHHHSDHNADYPCFVLCRWDQSIGKENSLQVYGSPPTEAITEKLFGAEGAFSADLAARIPDGTKVAIRTHNDDKGDRYAARVWRDLAMRCSLYRPPKGTADGEG